MIGDEAIYLGVGVTAAGAVKYAGIASEEATIVSFEKFFIPEPINIKDVLER